MEPMATANLTSEEAYWFSLSIYPITKATITKGRRSEMGVKDYSRPSADTLRHTHIHTLKDTDSEDVDAIDSVLVVVPVCCVVAAQQRSGLIALILRLRTKSDSYPTLNNPSMCFGC